MEQKYLFKTLDEFLSAPKPKIYYHIRPLLPIGGLMLIAGDVKTFKSYMALNIGYQIAAGKPVLGFWDVPRPLSVLYIEMEVGEYELGERSSVIHNYWHDSVAGMNFKIVSKDMRIQLDTVEGMKLLQHELEGAKPDVLILDPIVEFHTQDENSAIAMKSMLWPLRVLLHERHCSLVLVHHTAKSSEFRPGNNPASIRGSYLAGAANSIINLSKPVKGRDDVIQINYTTRSSKQLDPVTIGFNDITGGFGKDDRK